MQLPAHDSEWAVVVFYFVDSTVVLGWLIVVWCDSTIYVCGIRNVAFGIWRYE